MKLNTLSFKLLSIGFATFLISCEDETNQNQDSNSVVAPATYSFNRDGNSSVAYPGQSTRLAMGAELNDALLDFSKSKTDLLEMYANADANGNDVNPFQDPVLNTSSKSLRSKTAASYEYFNVNATESASIKAQMENWIEAQVDEIFPYVNQAATAGTAGQIPDGSVARYVNGQGLEFDQALGKSLIGALTLDQMLNHYLSPSVLDAGTNREDNENEVLVEGSNYTMMEHKWDEAYGYLFGGSADGSAPLSTLGSDDDFLNKYLGRLESDPDFAGIAPRIYNAFKLGRAAIVAGDYALRGTQAAIIREEMSEMIGVRAVYYLQAAKKAFNDGQNGTAFHDLSEAYGFIYSLRFTHNVATAQPYFNASEVQAFLGDLLGDGANGFWDLQASTLDKMSIDIAARFRFEINQVNN